MNPTQRKEATDARNVPCCRAARFLFVQRGAVRYGGEEGRGHGQPPEAGTTNHIARSGDAGERSSSVACFGVPRKGA